MEEDRSRRTKALIKLGLWTSSTPPQQGQDNGAIVPKGKEGNNLLPLFRLVLLLLRITDWLRIHQRVGDSRQFLDDVD